MSHRDDLQRLHKRRRRDSWEETSEQLISSSKDRQSQFGYDKKKTLSEICDARGDLWVHEKCATWTAATANSGEKLSVTKLVEKAISTVFLLIIFIGNEYRIRFLVQVSSSLR